MKMQEVKSSNVVSIGYEHGVMHVKYKSGDTYEFHGVSDKEHDGLIKAKSIGSHLYKMGIKGKKLDKKKSH